MPETLTPEQLQRKIEEMARKSGRRPPRKPPRKQPPAAADELYPGGPSVDTGDIRIARRGRGRPSRRGYA